MTIEYTNRKQQKFYLHQGQTKTGKPKYFFSMKSEGTSVDTLPDGYEIYENPNAQVFLRKIPDRHITLEEIATVRDGIAKHANLVNGRDFIIDVKNKNIVVHFCDQNIINLKDTLSSIRARNTQEAEEILARNLTYSPMMQFVLDDAPTRTFRVERWCFRGSIDDWIVLDCSDLKSAVERYGRHLDKESFYDLIPYKWAERSDYPRCYFQV